MCFFLRPSSTESFLGSHFCLLIYSPTFIKAAFLDPSRSTSTSGEAEISLVEFHSRMPPAGIPIWLIPPVMLPGHGVGLLLGRASQQRPRFPAHSR